jgi:hypothetical protein
MPLDGSVKTDCVSRIANICENYEQLVRFTDKGYDRYSGYHIQLLHQCYQMRARGISWGVHAADM